jgi:ribosome-binding protein aMBF1 (putative translation factor)
MEHVVCDACGERTSLTANIKVGGEPVEICKDCYKRPWVKVAEDVLARRREKVEA